VSAFFTLFAFVSFFFTVSADLALFSAGAVFLVAATALLLAVGTFLTFASSFFVSLIQR